MPSWIDDNSINNVKEIWSTDLRLFSASCKVMYIHRDIPCPTEAVVDEFACRQPRRLELTGLFICRSTRFFVFHCSVYNMKVQKSNCEQSVRS